MKVLFITNLFPNILEPTKAMFNKQMIAELSKLCDLKVIAPIPWYPRILPNKSKRSLFNQIPKKEEIDGIDVFHPRYLIIPKIARSIYGILLFTSLIREIYRIQKDFSCDIMFASWAYPDAYAVALLSKFFGKPFIVEILGTDINEFTKYYLRRKMIIFALNKASKIISVSNALKQRSVELGISEDKIQVIHNGVDKDRFKQGDKIQSRQKLGLPVDRKIILFVGNLVKVKGLDYLLDAICIIRDYYGYDNLILCLVGDGILKKDLQDKAEKLKIENTIRFEGVHPHNEIPIWLSACDLLCLPSINEGCPNVILEALACGRPVVASNVGGVSEILSDGKNGIMVPPGDPNKLAEAIMKALHKDWDIQMISKLSNSWKEVANKIMGELEALTGANDV